MNRSDKKFDIIVALDVCADIILTGDVVPVFGQIEKLIDDYHIEMGGSSCIFACQVAKLGLNVAGTGRYGQDALGLQVLNTLKYSGVDTEYLTPSQTLKTGVGFALCKDDDRAILTYIGTIAAQGLEGDLDILIEHTRHMHIGSYFLLKQLQQFYPELLAKAKNNGVTISLDTNWDPDEKWLNGLEEILPFVDIFMPNENELLAITGETDIETACKRLGRIIKIIAIKRGANGACVYTSTGGLRSAPALKVDYIDSIGAGDSFDGGFIYGYLNGKSPEDCLKYGVICGSMNTRGRGGIAAQISINDLDKIIVTIDNGGLNV